MSKRISNSAVFADSKPHYELLDGLRGIAAIMVVWYHIFEGFATSPTDQNFNHGYLAVDFFYILSGFVIAYAYDDRWKTSMTISSFFKRRLIRLHPMVIIGAILGVISYCLQGCTKWDGTQVSLPYIALALLANLILLPVMPGSRAEVRGNGEMYPLNGPSWSLFFEYIANILYALFIHRLSTKALSGLVCISGIGLAGFAIANLSGYHHLGVGWSLSDYNLLGGFLRVVFSFSAGLLIARLFKPANSIPGIFWVCSGIIIVLLSLPYIGAESYPWINGLYDSVCVLFVFPWLVYFGASGKVTGNVSSRIYRILGDLSYPLYIIHYPSMYLFYNWVWSEKQSFSQVWPVAVGLFLGNILLAALLLKIYDEPIRRWLSKKN